MVNTGPVAMTLYRSLYVQTPGLENAGAVYNLHVHISIECAYEVWIKSGSTNFLTGIVRICTLPVPPSATTGTMLQLDA